MYSQKIKQSIFYPKHNLRNVILESTMISRKHFLQYSFSMDKIKLLALKDIQNVKNRLKSAVECGNFLNIIKNIVSIPHEIKDQPSKILHVWAHQCECVVAQRLRRTQQMFSLYSKLWGENALKDFLIKIKGQIQLRSKQFIIGAVGAAMFDWDKKRIKDEEILKYADELVYIKKLKENTVKSDTPKGEVITFDNWTLFIEKNDLLVWRRITPSGAFEYKVYGSYNDVTAEDFLNVQVDIDYRKFWDETAVELELVETDSKPNSNSDIIYWEMLWPVSIIN